MRWLFLVLVIGNIAFFAWNKTMQQGSGPDNRQAVGPAPTGKELVMLAELSADKRPPLRTESEPRVEVVSKPVRTDSAENPEEPAETAPVEVLAQPQPAKLHCFRISGIEKQGQLKTLAGQLTTMQADVIDSGEEQLSQIRYWVILPPYKSRKAADAAISLLKQRKVKDFFLVRSGEYQHAISLGVFSSMDSAKRRLRDVAALRLKTNKPRLEELELPAKRNWLRFSSTGEDRVSVWQGRLEEFGIDNIEPVTCP